MTKFIKIWATPHPILQKQLNRRVLVILNVVLLILTPVFILLNLKTFSVILMITLSLLAIVLTFATRNLSNSIEISTDERESRLRDHAHRISYWVMAGVMGATPGLIFGYYSAHISKDNTISIIINSDSTFKLISFTLTFYILFSVFPTWIVAWLEPDPLED